MSEAIKAFFAILMLVVGISCLVGIMFHDVREEREIKAICAPFSVEGHTKNTIVCTSLKGYEIKLRPVEKE